MNSKTNKCIDFNDNNTKPTNIGTLCSNYDVNDVIGANDDNTNGCDQSFQCSDASTNGVVKIIDGSDKFYYCRATADFSNCKENVTTTSNEGGTRNYITCSDCKDNYAKHDGFCFPTCKTFTTEGTGAT